MGFLDFLKGKGNEPEQTVVTFPAALGAPAQGAFVAMDQIPDEVFSTGVLGTCCGVEPDTGNVYAPIGLQRIRYYPLIISNQYLVHVIFPPLFRLLVPPFYTQ